MEERRRRDESGQRKSVKRGWCLGDEAFRQELLAQLEPRSGRHHGGRERHLHRQTRGKLPIIGVGRILAAADAWEKIAAGVRTTD